MPYFIHTEKFLIVSALKGPWSRGTDEFCDQGKQNTCPDVNTR